MKKSKKEKDGVTFSFEVTDISEAKQKMADKILSSPEELIGLRIPIEMELDSIQIDAVAVIKTATVKRIGKPSDILTGLMENYIYKRLSVKEPEDD